MIVERKCKMETNVLYLNDVISFTLANNENHKATAVRQCDDGMIFIFNECMESVYRMNTLPNIKGGYNQSELRGILVNDVINTFPDWLRERMLPVYNDDLLTIPTEKEIFGYNLINQDSQTQFALMTERGNRKSIRIGLPETYWLMNESGNIFATCGINGNAACTYATNYCGVRPIFKLANNIY